MRYKRLLWQLFPSYLLITLIAIIAIGWLASRSLEHLYLRTVQRQLAVRAALFEKEIGDRLDDDQIARMREAARSFSDTSATRITVIDTSGRVLCDTSEDPDEMENHANRPELKAALAGEVGHQARFSNTLKQEMLYLAVPLRRHGAILGAVRTSITLVAIDEAQGMARRQFLTGGLAVAALAALISLVVSRRISRPLEEIRHGAERFSRGDLDYQLRIPDSAEMAGVARSLNEMASQLKQRIHTIAQHSSEQNAVLGSMTEGVLAVDHQGRIISLNDAAAGLLRCDREAALGRKADDVIFCRELLDFVRNSATRHEPAQADVVLQAGSQRIIEVRGTAMDRDNGAVIVLNDVTNIRRLETLRRDFVANVSHELKTPITSVKGFVETLLDGALDNRDDAERFLTIVAKQADRLGAIIDDLLSLAKIEENEESSDLQLQRAPVRDVLEMATLDCAAQARQRNINFAIECDEQLLADINPPLLEQAISNLLDNAVKYSDERCVVTIRAVAVGAEIVISVADQGIGIAEEHLSRLFERFYRVDKARSRKEGGTGLGLAIVKHIASAHRGRVEVESRPGSGTTFSIYLPQPLPLNKP